MQSRVSKDAVGLARACEANQGLSEASLRRCEASPSKLETGLKRFEEATKTLKTFQLCYKNHKIHIVATNLRYKTGQGEVQLDLEGVPMISGVE